MAVAILVFLPKLTIVFSPAMSDNSVRIDITMPLGTKFEETEKVVNELATYAEKELKVKYIIATTGSGMGFSSSSKSYKASLSITLLDEGGDNSKAVKSKMRACLKNYPKASFTFEQGQRMGERSDIDVTITSNNYAGMEKTAKQILDILKSDVPEVLEPTSDTDDRLPQVEISIDRARAASFGISVKAIGTEIRDAMKGYAATTYRIGGNEYDVWLRYAESDRSKIADIDRIFLLSSSGEKIPLSSLATVTVGKGPLSIHRTDQARTIDITGDLAPGKQANKVEQKIQTLVKDRMVIPDDVYVKYTGSWSELAGLSSSLLYIILLAILLVWGVMAGQYESWKDPFINLTTIPVMLIGVLAAYYFKGQNISMFTMLGIVMLIGIVVNNGILLVDATNLLRSRGAKLMDACIEGATSRFRPVILTAGTTIVGEIPMAYFPSDNSDITQPIGLAVLGGMITATFITMVLVPVVYYIFNKGKAQKEGTL